MLFVYYFISVRKQTPPFLRKKTHYTLSKSLILLILPHIVMYIAWRFSTFTSLLPGTWSVVIVFLYCFYEQGIKVRNLNISDLILSDSSFDLKFVSPVLNPCASNGNAASRSALFLTTVTFSELVHPVPNAHIPTSLSFSDNLSKHRHISESCSYRYLLGDITSIV